MELSSAGWGERGWVPLFCAVAFAMLQSKCVAACFVDTGTQVPLPTGFRQQTQVVFPLNTLLVVRAY
jgi:hypothetical protein